jgi:hypothetical protein
MIRFKKMSVFELKNDIVFEYNVILTMNCTKYYKSAIRWDSSCW